MPYESSAFYFTENQFNYTNYVKPYNNSFLEIWHNKGCRSQNLFVLREKIIKLIQYFEPCPEEADFLFQTHIYCMIKKYMIQIFLEEEISNCLEELTKVTNLFILAEKYSVNVAIRLVIFCDSKNNPINFKLSVGKKLETRKENFYDFNLTMKNFKHVFF